MKRLYIAYLIAAAIATAQETPRPAPSNEFFRLEFSLKELESGKVVNARSYQMMARTGEGGLSSIRSGGKLPVAEKGAQGFQYIDVGVNIDVHRLTHIGDELTLDVTSEVSGAIEPANPQTPLPGPPVVRQTRWSSIVLIPIRKQTVLFASDDPTSKRQLQLEVTATPMH